MQVAIVIPSGDMVHTDFAMSLMSLVSYTAMMTKDISTAIINPRSSLVQKGRYEGVRQAINMGADKILFIDSDQTFPADGLVRLIKHDRHIVGATCRLRQDDVAYSARDHYGERIDFRRYTGLHPVGSNGFPFVLIDTRVFRNIDEPWFDVSFENGEWLTEDESFCKAARKLDYSTWVDADLTKEIGHVGIKVY